MLCVCLERDERATQQPIQCHGRHTNPVIFFHALKVCSPQKYGILLLMPVPEPAEACTAVMHVHGFAERHVTVCGGHGSLRAVIGTSPSRTEAWAARPGAVSQEVMTARELRATTSVMTLMVLAGIAGFVTLLVLKNMLKARRCARQASLLHVSLGVCSNV